MLREVLESPRRAFVPMPDTQVIERPGWFQLVTPSLRDGGLNEVSVAVLAPERADAVIDETLAGYRDLGIRFRWTVGPDSAPKDLAARLQARGLQPESVIGVAVGVDDLSDALPSGADVEPVDEANVEEFTRVMADGWGVDPAPMLVLHRRMLAMAPEWMLMQLARIEGRPAAGSAVALFPRSAYLLGAVVLPEHRGRGLYRALVAFRAAEAARRGIALATAHARASTSARILRRVGFREVCQLTQLADPARAAAAGATRSESR